jgi:hypothetical protein
VTHDPGKREHLFRLREAMAKYCLLFGASAGEGRSDKIMRENHAK